MKFARRFSILAVLFSFVAAGARADYTAVVSPGSVVVSNFDGWGTSLCWWANVVGGYGNRDQYMNLAFGQLKLNIVRYNIGGGENPSGDFDGTIGEVAIFNRALTAAQVRALYAVAPVPALQMEPAGGGAVIRYTGTLHSSTNVIGPYAPVAGASNPYNVTPAGAQMFYRASNP